MTLEEYAAKILTDAGCDVHTYGGEFSRHIMDDLKQAFPGGMPEYTYQEVANAILAMSRPQPITRSPYIVVWNTDDCIDSYGCDSLGAAIASAEDTLVEWACQQTAEWESDAPTKEEAEDWNYMIYNCWVEVRQYNPKTDEYDTVWEPSDDDLELIGWKELPEDAP